jgi:hypothetical protein
MKICPECGREFGDDLTVCPDDGAKLEMLAVHPPAAVRRSTLLATTSLILGILSIVLCLGPVLGIPAVIWGHIALRRAKNKPAQFGGGGLAIGGLVTGYLGIAMILVLWALLAPAFSHAKAKAQALACSIKLVQIEAAMRSWSANHQGRLPDSLLDLTNELSDPNLLICPADRNRHASGSRAIQVWDPDNVTYQLVTPGAALSNVEKQVIIRCPIHGLELLGDGSVTNSNTRRPNAR